MQELSDDIHRDLDAYREQVSRWMRHEVVEDAQSLRRLQQSIHSRLRLCVGAPQDARVVHADGLSLMAAGDIKRICSLPSGTVTAIYRPSDNTVFFWRG